MICIGHRGARAYAPENTLDSIEVAIEHGAQWVEVDIRTHSNELIVLHDEHLDRTTNGNGHIEQQTLATLRTLDAGNGQQIPLLQEVISHVNRRVIINIELKDTNCIDRLIMLIEEFVEAGWQYDDFLISSFFHHQLQQLKQRQPRILIGVLSAGVMLEYAKFAQELNAWSINLCAQSITQALVDDAKERGLKVLVYTVNNQQQFAEFKAMGVDGLFTDYPKEMLTWLATN